MNRIFQLTLTILILIFQTQANLSVYNAQSLGLNSGELGLDNVNFSIANFGFVPYDIFNSDSEKR